MNKLNLWNKTWMKATWYFVRRWRSWTWNGLKVNSSCQGGRVGLERVTGDCFDSGLMYPSFSTWLLPSCHPVPPRCTTCPLPSPPSSSFQLSREVSAVGVDLAARVQPGICLCNPASSGGARQERRRQVDVSRWNIQTLSTNPDYISSLNTLSLIAQATQQLQDVNINIYRE